jgi:hypothetical protein
MEVKQIYELINGVTKEVIGQEGLVKEDLSNVVDLGDAVFNANAMDKYVKTLVNHIGKVIFVNRSYRGGVPSVLMDSWEFGSVLQKIQMDMPEATENESWELEDGTSYDPNIFYKPKISAKFFNKAITFEIPISITEKQVRQSFDNATQLNAFVSMIYNAVDKSMTVKMDSLIMRTINNEIAETVYAEYTDGKYGASSGVRAVNLLKLYNDKHPDAVLTRAKALEDPEFLRFASMTISLYTDRMTRMSTLFNVGGKERFTPKDLLHVVVLTDFAKATESYLQSNTYHDEMVKLPGYETVPYWQGSGKTYALDDVSAINVKTASGHDVALKGVIGVMFDRDALGVCNEDRRTTSNYNPKAEFFNNFVKFDCRYFNDLNENCVVFFLADTAE